MISMLLKSTLFSLALLISFSAFAADKDPDDIGNGWKVFLGGLAYFAIQLVNNAWNTFSNRKVTGEAAKKVGEKTDSVSIQISTVSTKFAKDLKDMESHITKQIEDLRFQQKTVIAAMHDEFSKFKEGLDSLRAWVKANRPPTDAGTLVPEHKKKP